MFLPLFLGYWLIINGLAYLTMSFAGLIFPQYEEKVSNIAFTPSPRRDGVHVLARDQGHKGAAVGHRSFLIERLWRAPRLLRHRMRERR